MLNYRFFKTIKVFHGFPSGSLVKNPPANEGDSGDVGLIPGLGRSPGGGNGNPLQYSCLRNPMDRGACQATVYRVTKSWTQLSTHNNNKVFQILFSVVLEKILASSWITIYSTCTKGWTSKQCPLRIELGIKGWTIFSRPRTRTTHCCRGGGVHVWVLDSNAGAGRKFKLAGNSWTLIGKCKSLRHVWLFATLWTIPSMEFSRPEYWSG